MAAVRTQESTIAHFVSRYLFLTGSWIHTQLINLRNHRPIVLTSEMENLKEFPFDPIFCYDQILRGEGIWRVAARKLYESITHKRNRYFCDILLEQNVKLLHAHFGTEGYYQLGVQRSVDLPLITTFYGADMSQLPTSKPQWRHRYRKLFETGSLFLAEGPYMAQAIVDLGCRADNVKVLHLGVDVDRIEFVSRRLDDGAIRILMASSFREKKGIPYGIRGFAQAVRQFPNMTLRIIGGAKTSDEHRLMDECRHIVSEEGIANKVTFLGYLPYSRYLEETRSAHLFLAPSVKAVDGDTEGGAPVSIIEAAAAGMPVISTTHCDIPNVVIDGKTGLLVPERDASRLCQAILDLAGAPDSWPRMGAAGRERVETEFNVVRQVGRLEEFYRKCL